MFHTFRCLLAFLAFASPVFAQMPLTTPQVPANKLAKEAMQEEKAMQIESSSYMLLGAQIDGSPVQTYPDCPSTPTQDTLLTIQSNVLLDLISRIGGASAASQEVHFEQTQHLDPASVYMRRIGIITGLAGKK